jgi:hypothetical protein
MDLDDLINEINNAGEQKKSKTKKKKIKQESESPITTNQIVQTFEAIKLGDPKKVDENIKNVIEMNTQESVVQVLNDEIKVESNLDILEEEKKKKKKKKKKKPTTGAEADEKNVEEEIETKINQYKNYFDFSGKTLTNSRFQDNESVFRVIKNWQDKPWNQTYFINK